ncbi:BTAD domain-containing putative transcriptional regulator [Saccharothrix saharensis]|uniref:BTAD domain-containing putative transcriptional regulator n=1 Tax=Saccharothrix saharensis TaxID=571190 RepID=UPI0036B46E4B
MVEAGTAATRDPQRAIESLRAALALCRGTPFADLEVTALADWARRLAERRLTAVESLHEAESTCGVHQVGELTDLVRAHPLRERLHVLLMTALHRTGRRTEALDAYRRARHALVSELGLEPGPELRDLHRRILTDDLPAAPRAPRRIPAQLPVDVPGFVGREAELAELDGLLSSDGPVPIAAVTGTPGVGKTALAVRWAHQVRDRFPDGQLYADLRGHGPDEPLSAADVLAAFLRSSGLDAIPDRLDERAARFRTLLDQRRMLIVLDNARSVDQVRPLLPGGSSCLVLVTSRDSLAGLVARHGAHRIPLDRLPSADAVSLLRELLGDRADAEPEALATLVERWARLLLAPEPVRTDTVTTRHRAPAPARPAARDRAAATADRAVPPPAPAPRPRSESGRTARSRPPRRSTPPRRSSDRGS